VKRGGEKGDTAARIDGDILLVEKTTRQIPPKSVGKKRGRKVSIGPNL